MTTRSSSSISLLALVLSLAACGQPHAPETVAGVPAAASLLVGFVAAAGELPEGVALKDGRAYVGFAPLGRIDEVDLRSGSKRPFGTLPAPVPNKGFMTGLTFGPSGDLYAALVSFDSSVQAGVYRVPSGGGDAVLFAKDARMVFPNGLLFDARGDLYVTDSAAGTIFRVTPTGVVSPWTTSELLAGDASACGGSGNPFPIGANGLVISSGSLFATNTDKGSLVRVPEQQDGTAGEPEVVAGPDCAALAGADGVTTDVDGDFVVAVNRQNKVVRVPPSGTPVSELVSGAPVEFPASLAWDDTTLILTSFALANASTGKPAKPGLVVVSSGR